MNKKVFMCFMVIILLGICIESFAADLVIPSTLGQDNLKKFTKELGGALAYRQYQPAKPLGLTGFDVGVQVHASPVKSKDVWDDIFSGTTDAPSVLPVPMVYAKKGLPLNIDLGVRGVPIPGTDIKIMGANIKYSILEGTAVTPSVAVAVDYSQVSGSKDFDLNVMTVNASISKGFPIVTPYGGIAMDQANLKIKNDLLKAALKDEKATTSRMFAGVKISPLPLLALTVEANLGEITSYGAALSVGF